MLKVFSLFLFYYVFGATSTATASAAAAFGSTSTAASLFVGLLAPAPAYGKKVNSAGAADLKLLRAVEGRYQKDQGIVARLKRTVTLEALGTEKKAKGMVHINRGKMHLEMSHPTPEKVVLDGRWIWMVSPPPKGFPGAKTQVLKASMKSKQARSQGLIQILTRGQILKYFDVSGVESLGRGKKEFWLQPGTVSKEFKRAKIVVSESSQEITELMFWDHRGNRTSYEFLKTRFRQKIPSQKFIYHPPKDAEIISEGTSV